MKHRERLLVLAVVTFVVTQGTFWLGYTIGSRSRPAARPAPCLHGESSIRGELRHGRFVVTAGPHRTGCTPGTR